MILDYIAASRSHPFPLASPAPGPGAKLCRDRHKPSQQQASKCVINDDDDDDEQTTTNDDDDETFSVHLLSVHSFVWLPFRRFARFCVGASLVFGVWHNAANAANDRNDLTRFASRRRLHVALLTA